MGREWQIGYDSASEALQKGKPAATDRRYLILMNHSFTLDFIVTGESKEILQEKVKPAIDSFLSQRGLNLSGEKTRITRIEDGFDFLGQHLRKYGEKFIVTPSKTSVKGIVSKARKIIKSHLGSKTVDMLGVLNPVIRGWANYHRHACSKEAFRYVDYCIFKNLWKWAKRRHPNKKAQWI